MQPYLQCAADIELTFALASSSGNLRDEIIKVRGGELGWLVVVCVAAK